VAKKDSEFTVNALRAFFEVRLWTDPRSTQSIVYPVYDELLSACGLSSQLNYPWES
jgi:hypothetical protein